MSGLFERLSGQRPPPLWRRGARMYRFMAGIALLLACGYRGSCGSPSGRLLEKMRAGRITRPGLAYGLAYRLYVPPNYDPAKKYPLLLFLHGSGARGDDNRQQVGEELAHFAAALQALEPVFVLAPQCPRSDKWVSGGRKAPFLNYRVGDRAESDANKLVLALLDDLGRQYSLDDDRLYVSGYSSGAAGTWDLLLRRPSHPFAAAVPVTGTNDPQRAARVASLPLWVFHGSADALSPVDNAREMVSALQRLGSAVRYTEYAEVGHGTLGLAYREADLPRWLLGQRRTPPRP